MTFSDAELQQRYERVVSSTTAVPEDLRSVFALMDAWDVFRILEGEDAGKVREIIQTLTSPELRLALRRWYQDPIETMNPAAQQFRQKLSELVGEIL